MVGSGDRAPATVVLRLPASPAHVRTARLVAAAMARRSGVDESLLDEVRLAVGEACARAVRQHERHGVQEPVTVEFVDQGTFGVAVIDRAPVSLEPSGAGPAGRAAPATGAAPPTADTGLGGGSRTNGPDDSLATAQLDQANDILAALQSAQGGSAPVGLRRAEIGADGLDATADSLGLALLGAVVQDLAVTPAEAGIGTRVSMSWPLED